MIVRLRIAVLVVQATVFFSLFSLNFYITIFYADFQVILKILHFFLRLLYNMLYFIEPLAIIV